MVVQVVYDELAVRDDYEGVDITRLTQELTPKSRTGINLMHISVDGKPIDDPDRSSADVQRCTDVALEKANIQFQFDNLKSRPRLGVVVLLTAVPFHPLGKRSSASRCDSARTPTTGLSSNGRKCGYSRRGSRPRLTRWQSLRSIPMAWPNGNPSCHAPQGPGAS